MFPIAAAIDAPPPTALTISVGISTTVPCCLVKPSGRLMVRMRNAVGHSSYAAAEPC